MDKISSWLTVRLENTHHRQILLITGDEAEVKTKVTALLAAIEKLQPTATTLTCGTIGCHNLTSNSSYTEHLGKEYQYLFYDALEGFRINAFTALAGTVSSNGLVILITPNLDQWPSSTNQDFLHRVSYGFEAEVTDSLFLAHFCRTLKSHQHLLDWRDTDIRGEHYKVNDIEQRLVCGVPTEEQQVIIDGVLNVATGHRKRPLVIRADRGRGKSAALGFATNDLIKLGKKVAITAPSKKIAASVFKHINLDHDKQTQASFCAIDDLTLYGSDVDLVIVDEAAAIPNNLLRKLIKRFSRIVFSTTTYGYEGTGRGFDVRFLPYLQTHMPDYKQAYLTHPIRWFKNDALETFLWEACHLAPFSVEEIASNSILNSSGNHFLELSKEMLFNDNLLLNTVFTLLVEAHYQTSPDDLMAMLDAPEQRIFAVINSGCVNAVVMANEEGNIVDNCLSEAIVNGDRRVKGHLLAQQATLFSGELRYLKERYLRVVRIAVPQEKRRQRCGSAILHYVEDWAHKNSFNFIGTAFAAAEDTLRFWLSNDYQPILLGFKKDTSSGEHSIIMLKEVHAESVTEQQLNNAQSSRISDLVNEGRALFSYHISGLFNELDSTIALQLLEHWADELALETFQQEKLKRFAQHNSSVELAMPCIAQALNLRRTYKTLETNQLKLLLRLALQHWHYKDIAVDCDLTGKKAVIAAAREAVAKLLR